MEELSQTQLNHLNATLFWEQNRDQIRQSIFPQQHFVDLRHELHTEFHSESPYIYDQLRRLLPFGVTLTAAQKTLFTNPVGTNGFRQAYRQQLLIWYLHRVPNTAGEPITQLSIFYHSDQFWFGHVLPNRAWISHRLLSGTPIYFVQQFVINHSYLEIVFGELRLVTNRPEILPFLDEGNTAWTIVHAPGDIIRFTYTQDSWETINHFPSNQLVDPPQPYFLPLTAPPPGFQAVPELYLNYYTSLYDSVADRRPTFDPRQALLNDSDFDTTDTDSVPLDLEPVAPQPISGWEQLDNRPPNQSQCCFCEKELCSCGHRPNTPPTPSHITLWTPGDKHLPWRD